MPHRHPEDRVYTVISGVFYIGLGDQFDGDKVQAYPPGSVLVLPGETVHFKGLVRELTFAVKSVFFVMLGYWTDVGAMADWQARARVLLAAGPRR